MSINDLITDTSILTNEQKDYFNNKELIDYLLKNNFWGNRIIKVLSDDEWEKKIDWIFKYYKTYIKPLEVLPATITDIAVQNQGLEKLKWIKNKYSILYNKYNIIFTPMRLKTILKTKDWNKRVKWVEDKAPKYYTKGNELYKRVMREKSW